MTLVNQQTVMVVFISLNMMQISAPFTPSTLKRRTQSSFSTSPDQNPTNHEQKLIHFIKGIKESSTHQDNSSITASTTIQEELVLTNDLSRPMNFSTPQPLLRRLRRGTSIWDKTRRLRGNLAYKHGRHKEFKSKYIHVKPTTIYEFLDYLKDWRNLTVVQRHKLLRSGRLYRPMKLFLHTQTSRNLVLTWIGKIRRVFTVINSKTGLDNLVEKVLQAKGVNEDKNNPAELVSLRTY